MQIIALAGVAGQHDQPRATVYILLGGRWVIDFIVGRAFNERCPNNGGSGVTRKINVINAR